MTKAVNKTTIAGATPEATSMLARRIARNVIAARIALDLSQDQLVSRSGVSKGTIVQIEQGDGNPNVATLCRLAVALGLSVEDLVSDPQPGTARIILVEEAKVLWGGLCGSTASLLVGTRGPNMLELWSWQLASGECYQSEGHSPGTREIVSVTKGTLRLELDDHAWEVAAGTAAAFYADRRHAYIGRGSGMTNFMMVVEEPAVSRSLE